MHPGTARQHRSASAARACDGGALRSTWGDDDGGVWGEEQAGDSRPELLVWPRSRTVPLRAADAGRSQGRHDELQGAARGRQRSASRRGSRQDPVGIRRTRSRPSGCDRRPVPGVRRGMPRRSPFKRLCRSWRSHSTRRAAKNCNRPEMGRRESVGRRGIKNATEQGEREAQRAGGVWLVRLVLPMAVPVAQGSEMG
jgi:hypothetical protein